MRRKTAANWLNMLLVLLLALGSWPVSAFAETNCPRAMKSALAADHGDCKTGEDQQQHPSVGDHCCPIAFCAALVFLPSGVRILFKQYQTAAVASPDKGYRFDSSAPLTRPPITHSIA